MSGNLLPRKTVDDPSRVPPAALILKAEKIAAAIAITTSR